MGDPSAFLPIVAAGLIVSAFLLDQRSTQRSDGILRGIAGVLFLLGAMYGVLSAIRPPPDLALWAHGTRLAALVALIGLIVRANLAR
ncbi:MAG TPA: hypothetical protein VFV70_01985 [Hyphomonadaceae bacterium]|nr:hypothetical protein [Hyphomonadaceae bacterium]